MSREPRADRSALWPVLAAALIVLIALMLWLRWPDHGQSEPVARADQAGLAMSDTAPAGASASSTTPSADDEAAASSEATTVASTDAVPEPEYEVVEFPDSASDDPYTINEFISPPEPGSGIQQTDMAPSTAAEDDPAMEVVAGEFINSVEPPAPASEAGEPALPAAEPTIRKREFQGDCPDGSSAAQPLPWQQLTPEARLAFPKPRLGVTSSRGGPERRFVMVGRQVVREGQSLPSGGVLLRLTSSTVVIASGGCAVAIPLRLLIH